jgi:two-component sensor histidine kinase
MAAPIRWRGYGFAVAAVLLAFVARMGLEPLLHGGHPYLPFYPVVLVSAYVLGRGPAICAAVLAGGLAYWSFAEPAFGLAAGADVLTPLLFFAVTCGTGIYLITALTQALERLAADQGRLRAAADAHAGLFQELQARMGHHMSLVAGVLSLQARGEPDPEVLALLRKAGARSELIARAHREVSGDTAGSVEFVGFATALAQGVCRETQQAYACVRIAGAPVTVPIETATSIGVALAEALTWILKRGPTGVLEVRLLQAPGRLCLTITHTGEVGAEIISLAPAAYMFRAMVEQLGAQVETIAEDAPGLALSVPLTVADALRPPETTLH